MSSKDNKSMFASNLFERLGLFSAAGLKRFKPPWEQRFNETCLDSRGLVLVTALALLTVLLTLGVLFVRNMSMEIKLAGSYETDTRSLFVAEGGLEIVKGEIKSNVTTIFSADGYSAGNSQEYQVQPGVSPQPMTTLTNPVNWGTNGWYVTKNGSASTLFDPAANTLLTNSNATWPIYKRVSVGSDYAVVTLGRPLWFYSNPTRVRFPVTSEADHLFNPALKVKSVSSTFEVNMGNNFLVFQTFSDPSDDQSYMDNIANNVVVVGNGGGHYGGAGGGYDYGIDAGGSNAISGIWTYGATDKTLLVQSCALGNPGSFTGCVNFGIPEVNTINRTFLLGGSGHGCLFGGAASNATITVSAGTRYKITYSSGSVVCP
ncbi:MAG: hypothetical protein ACE5GQ_01405 [Nitrospinales bacterium]